MGLFKIVMKYVLLNNLKLTDQRRRDMKILLVEDDPKISSFVRIGLESSNYQVDTAYDSAIGERLALSRKYDVMILDVVIPGISGFELCKKIRNINTQTPILMLNIARFC